MSRARRRPVAVAARPSVRHALPQPPHALLAAVVGGLGRTPGTEGPLTVARSAQPRAPALLAARRGGSAEERARRQTVYEQCLSHYRAVVHPGDTVTDNVGAAAALFVAACLAVLHGIRPPHAALRRLEEQLVAMVHFGSAWRKSDEAEHQLCFEQMAVLAVLFAAVATNPRTAAADVAQARHWAHVYLKELLGLDPGTLTIDDGGLAVRREPRAA